MLFSAGVMVSSVNTDVPIRGSLKSRTLVGRGREAASGITIDFEEGDTSRLRFTECIYDGV